MTEEPYRENIETWCSVIRAEVFICLESSEEPKGTLISGKPISCQSADKCKAPLAPLPNTCLLRALNLESRRRKK